MYGLDMHGQGQAYPYVVELVDMGVRRGEEYLVCELAGGMRYELMLGGTSLEGYVYDYKRLCPGPFTEPLFIEIGRNADGTHYIEMLFRADEFAAFHGLDAELSSLAWMELHRVPPGTGAWLPLYYGVVGVPLV